MSVSGNDFIIEAAAILEDASASEIKCRIAISRSYYGLYHAALAYADTISQPPVSSLAGPSHRKLSIFFEGNLNKDQSIRLKFRKVGYKLKQLHESRCKADYSINSDITYTDAISDHKACKSLVNDINELKKLNNL